MSAITVIDPGTGEYLDGISEGSLSAFESNRIPRFVNDDNYSSSFGFQWNKFEKTQIDRFENGQSQSKVRLFAETGWKEGGLSGECVLEVGSGAGRFTRVLLECTKANIYSVDYSNAVEANFRNNSEFGSRLNLFQASVYALPFLPEQFDKVLCLGVLQHTPDFRHSVECLIKMVKPGGELVIDFYPVNGWWTKCHAKYLFRPLTKSMRPEKLLTLIENNVDWLIKLFRFNEKIGIGRFVNRFLPVCDIKSTMPPGISGADLREWVILDTFDMFSPSYDNPQKVSTVREWVESAGLIIKTAGFVYFHSNSAAVIRAVKPA